MDLIKLYINRGRFGRFVESVVEEENARKQEQADREENWKLWVMYVSLISNGLTDESFNDWKKRVCRPTNADTTKRSGDENLTDDGIKVIIDKLFPS